MESKRLAHRRAFLRGAGGIVVALPFLESFAPRRAFAADAIRKRFAVYFQCNGVLGEKWWPTAYGDITAEKLKGTALEPLSKHASKLLVPRGIAMTPKGFGQDGGEGDDHTKGMVHKLTCSLMKGGKPGGPSIDYVLAKALNQSGADPLVFGTGDAGTSGGLGSAFYKPSGQKADFQKDPTQVFKTFMGGSAPEGMQTMNSLIAARRKSVLDVVKEDMTSLQNDSVIGKADKMKLQMHFESLRRLEMNLPGGGGGGGSTVKVDCKAVPKDPAAASSFEKNGMLFLDLMALAFACNVNQVASLQNDRGAGGPMYNWLPDKQNRAQRHHPLSHGATTDAATNPNLPEAEWKTALFNVDHWHQKQMGYFLDRLASYAEGEGTVLDNTVVMYINELSNGLGHTFMDLPIVLAGSAGGNLKSGQYIKMTTGSTTNLSECPTNQLYVTIANALGVKMDNFGPWQNGKKGPFSQLFSANYKPPV